MPKNKTHSGIKKRVRVTGRGKLRTERANMQHKFEHKSSRHKRRLSGTSEVASPDVPRIKKMLGI
ncbi:large subunit ribosomal protein L35 [Jatrophihabitans endophyticus]|uniref:Large ribosomal subunit protein bL35 n=1 Tax=Jatrophihabitans endophyticus TaxID=1206085 RepID=A0A1M5MK51_9ACTN|nr:50S ribosomal protein L35 [Jatrophihabitans endophyticus]SHG77884.1 large subunit ribosomal protein L35 [Jatrophihabitans endophyticus]